MKLLFVLIAFACLIASLVLLNDSEVHARRDIADLNGIASQVVEAGGETLDTALEGKIVHVSGQIAADSVPVDPDTGVTIPALSLHREVQMFQWRPRISLYTTHRPTFWSSVRARSGPTLTDPKAPVNPIMPFETQTFYASNPHLGPYRLDNALASVIELYHPTPIGPKSLVPGGNLLYEGADPSNPQVGDVRVLYSHVPSQEVSLIAIQKDNRLAPVHSMRTGRDILLIRPGDFSAAWFTDTLRHKAEALQLAWRLAAFAVMGFAMLKLLQSAANEKTSSRTVLIGAPCSALLILAGVLSLYGGGSEPSLGIILVAGCAPAGLIALSVNKFDQARENVWASILYRIRHGFIIQR